MRRPRQQLLRLNAGELGERAVGRLIAPDALAGREHGIAAIAFLVITIVLVAMHHHLVAHLPVAHLAAHGPDDAGGVGTGDMIIGLVDVERRYGRAQPGPDAVVVDAAGHDQNQHFVAVQLRHVHDLDLHGFIGRAMALAADAPGIHFFWHVAQGRNLAHLVKVLALLFRSRFGGGRR